MVTCIYYCEFYMCPSATLLVLLLHFLNFLSFCKYLNGKDGVALCSEPFYIRACTVYEIKLALLLIPQFSWTRRLVVDCNEISTFYLLSALI